MNIRIENWQNKEIRFVEKDGEWWAVLNDICNALNLKIDVVVNNLKSDTLSQVKYGVSDLFVLNELGFYDILLTSDTLEARNFRRWSTSVLQKLRNRVGLKPYEIMRMTESDIQEEINHMLDNIFWDDEKEMLMESVTIAGGDVEQIPFDGFESGV